MRAQWHEVPLPSDRSRRSVHSVDAVATLSSARKLTKRPALRGIVLDGVQSDGTVDVSEGPGRVRYTFQSAAGQGAQPAREPGTLPKRITCGKQNVVLRKEGLVAEADHVSIQFPPLSLREAGNLLL